MMNAESKPITMILSPTSKKLSSLGSPCPTFRRAIARIDWESMALKSVLSNPGTSFNWTPPTSDIIRACTSSLRFGTLHLPIESGHDRSLYWGQGLIDVLFVIELLLPVDFLPGRPVFISSKGKRSYKHPQNSGDCVFDREINVSDGSMYWTFNGNPFHDDGALVQDTKAMWGFADSDIALDDAPDDYMVGISGPRTSY